MPLIRAISVSGSIPTVTQLALGDLAINTFDGKAYIKKYANNTQTIIELGSGGASVSASYALSSSYSDFSLTASYALQALSASYAPDTTFPYTGSALITGSLGLTGSLSTTDTVFLKGLINQTSPQNHVVIFDNTTGRLYITASSAFGGGGGGGSTPGGNFDTIQYNNAGVLDGSDDFKLVGGNSVYLTGSLLVSGSTYFTGSVSSLDGFTGSLYGTSSWAISSSQAISASYAATASSADIFVVRTALTASGLNYPTVDGLENQVLETDGNGNLVFDDIHTMLEDLYSGEALTKGDPLYISGSQGALPIVYKADSADPAKMPVAYVAAETVNSGVGTRGIILGLIEGINLTGYPAGTEVYVGSGGGWTSTRPTGSSIVQVLGYVTKEGSGGKGLVLNPGPSNLPNLPSGSAWVGNSDSIPTAVLTSSFHVSSSISSSYATTASYALQALSSSYSTNSLLLNSTASTVFATTGSNLFRGDQNITGSVSITGSLTVSGPNADVNLTATNIVLNAGTLRAPLLPVSSPPGGALLNTVLIDALNGTLYVTSSLPGTGGGGTAGPTDRILTGSITASVADGTNPSNPNFFLIQSGSVEMLKFNTERVMVLETRTDTPTAVTGAIFYSASGDFFFGTL